ncbi:putative FBD domain, leucine-rich repeat domain superfamily [Helianthus anomalus]
MSCRYFYAILQVLLLRQAPIHEFNLTMTSCHTFFEIDHIIRHLLKNHMVKKLKLDFFHSRSDGLPLSVFSMHHLTDLDLKYCNIKYKPIFNGFGSLTSLSLDRVTTSRETLLHILSNCSSLKSLYLLFDLDSVPQGFSISLIHVKHFCFNLTNNVFGMAFLAVLIKCSPNLERIKLEIDTFDMIDVESVKPEEYSFTFEEVSKFWLEHLNEVEIKNYRNFKPMLEFVKFILARSPILKKVILLTYRVDKNDELEMLTILSHAPCASPGVIVENHRLENDD